MEITSNYSITNLFASKQIKIYVDNTHTFGIVVKSIRDFIEDDDWHTTYRLMARDLLEWRELFQQQIQYDEPLYYLQVLMFQLGAYKQYAKVAGNIEKYLKEIIPGVKINGKEKTWEINGVTITPEIWNYVVYLLKLTCGEKVQKPRIFESAEEKAFFIKQQEMENRIKKIKRNANDKKEGGEDQLMKKILAISYSFPHLSFDYLFDQTMAQIHWLATYAAQEVSYRVSSQAYAAGNLKKGSKLDFFIK